MMIDVLVSCVTMALAELGDKTQLTVLLLSSKTKKHFQLLFGVLLAYFLVDGFAIFIGSRVAHLIPKDWLQIIAGLFFIVFGVFILKNKEEETDRTKTKFQNPFLSGFVLIFISEWGDKTQIAAGLLAAKYNSWMVLLGALTALTAVSSLGLYMGHWFSKRVKPKAMAFIVGVLFIVIGISFLLNAIWN